MKQVVLPLVVTLLVTAGPVLGANIQFGGYEWRVRSGAGGPGPNQWDEANVCLDASGALHLKISQTGGKWTCAEVTMQKRLGFGRYEFEIKGPIDRLDENVVLGLFNYPTSDVGPDATHEIDIEFARWGNPANPIGNYTVWPVTKELKHQTHSFPFTLAEDTSIHRFTWSTDQVLFQSLRPGHDAAQEEFGRWLFRPDDRSGRIARQPMPVHINLWLFQGHEPKNREGVEVIVKSFRFERGTESTVSIKAFH